MSIDFVIMWVDGNDKLWQKELLKYKKTIDFERYREWDNLKYLFRGIEKYTPWVRKVHFVTWGHIPSWLDIENPKINVVYHKDILEEENMPVFNSQAIEVNLHKIRGLSEKFVYFNDDTFLMKPMKENKFFRNGLPCDFSVFNVINPSPMAHILINNLEIINKYYSKTKFITKNFNKIFNYKYEINLIRSLLLVPWPKFTGFLEHHMPCSFLKKSFEEVWELEEEILKKTCSSKFRQSTDVNQYLFRYWQIAKGKFYPKSFKKTKYVSLTTLEKLQKDKKEILNNDYEMICLNDEFEGNNIEFNKMKLEIIQMFDFSLNEQSSYEKMI